jgi:hypothetical protein
MRDKQEAPQEPGTDWVDILLETGGSSGSPTRKRWIFFLKPGAPLGAFFNDQPQPQRGYLFPEANCYKRKKAPEEPPNHQQPRRGYLFLEMN